MAEQETEPGSHTTARQRRRRVLGYLCYLIGCATAVATVLVTFALFGHELDLITGVVTMTICLIVAVTLLIVAEGFLVPDLHEVLASDARSPVVYLRPFGEDTELTYDVISTGESTTSLTAKAEDFLMALNAVGPLITIAEPDLSARIGVHPHGVARDFVGEGDWQARVQELLEQAGMVVLAIGDSPGIEWEIAEVQKRIAPQDMLLYLPPRPTSALTRKGRQDKEQAVYEKFAPLVERHFGIDMPPFSEATYIIGFDAEGKAVMVSNPAPRRWHWTEHGRTAKAIRSQLDDVLDKVRPGIDLHQYRLPGRAGLWTRLAVSLTVTAATALVGLTGASLGSGLLSPLLSVALVHLLPSVALVVGWVLIARHFSRHWSRRWVWSIPILLGLLTTIHSGMNLTLELGYYEARELMVDIRYQLFTIVLQFGYALAVLALGLGLLGRHAGPSR